MGCLLRRILIGLCDSPMCTRTVTRGYYVTGSFGHDIGILLQQPELLEIGKVYRYEIDLWATSNVFLPGHRVRVSVTSSCFPRFDRNLNTGGSVHNEAAGQVAINTVMHDEMRPSHIVLPVIKRN